MTDQDAYEQWYQRGLEEACRECANHPDFIAEFNRLQGRNFGPHCCPGDDDAQAFIAMVEEYVWRPTVEAIAQERDRGESH